MPRTKARDNGHRPPSFDEGVEQLVDELSLAIRWDRPAILLGVCDSRPIMQRAQARVAALLRSQGQHIGRLRVDSAENADIPLRLMKKRDRAKTIFFVQDLEAGGATTLNALNIRREYLVEYRLRTVFWVTRREEIMLAQHAPDFWAFRHRVVHFAQA